MASVSAVLAGCGTGGGEVARTPPPDCVPQRDNLIVPGCRIGPITIGLDPAEVFGALGSPQKSNVGTGPTSISTYVYQDVSVNVRTATNRVSEVFTSSPRYSTAEGVRVGMSELELRAKLSAPSRARQFNPVNLTYYYTRGLEVVFNPQEGSRVVTISVNVGR